MNRFILAVCAILLAPVALGETVAVVGGDVLTVGPAGRIAGATVLIKDGLITAVGPDVQVPDDARVIDAKGKTGTPGLLIRCNAATSSRPVLQWPMPITRVPP